MRLVRRTAPSLLSLREMVKTPLPLRPNPVGGTSAALQACEACPYTRSYSVACGAGRRGNSASTSRPEPARNRLSPERHSFGLRDQAFAWDSERTVSTRLYLTDMSASLIERLESGYNRLDRGSSRG